MRGFLEVIDGAERSELEGVAMTTEEPEKVKMPFNRHFSNEMIGKPRVKSGGKTHDSSPSGNGGR
jgi:hypothetical protein